MKAATNTARTAAASRIVCHECDLLNDVPELAPGRKAYCPRCGFMLAANRPNSLTIVFSLSITAVVLLILANAFPFLGFAARGQEQTVTLIQSVAILITEDFPELAFVVFASIIAVPAILLAGLIYVSTGIATRTRLPGIRRVLRWTLEMVPWSMAEIFLIGILVSFIKIVSLADVALGMSFWSYALFTVCMVIVVIHIDRRELWRRVSELPRA